MHGSILAMTIPPGTAGICIFVYYYTAYPPGHIEKDIPHPGDNIDKQLQSSMYTEVKKTNFSQRRVGVRKLKNGAGDGANTHVFNIKPCVFPAKFRTPSCQTMALYSRQNSTLVFNIQVTKFVALFVMRHCSSVFNIELLEFNINATLFNIASLLLRYSISIIQYSYSNI